MTLNLHIDNWLRNIILIKTLPPQATALFQDLNQAYHTLTNATLRAEYDLSIGISEHCAHMNHDDNVSHRTLPNLDFKRTAQNEEINRLKSDNNRLMQKVNNLQNTNSDLKKLIETTSDTYLSTPNMAESY